MLCTENGFMVQTQYCSEWSELRDSTHVRFLCSESIDDRRHNLYNLINGRVLVGEWCKQLAVSSMKSAYCISPCHYYCISSTVDSLPPPSENPCWLVELGSRMVPVNPICISGCPYLHCVGYFGAVFS